MNENINLCEILKGCEGIKLYSSIFGYVILERICLSIDNKHKLDFKVLHKINEKETVHFFTDTKGKYEIEYPGECTIFPSKEQRDWSKFEKPIPVDTPMMCSDNRKDWALRYYCKLSSSGHLVYYFGEKSNSHDIANGGYKYMIPFNKFDPLNIEESLKYNIQKSEEVR